MSAPRPPLRIEPVDWGLVPYLDGIRRQREAVAARVAGSRGDTLFLLEHPHVLTLGRNARTTNLRIPKGELGARGVELHETDRGGDVTYHGPGQLVGYPIVLLPEGRRDVRRYVRDLEEALLRTLGDFGIAAGRAPGMTGVWVGTDKVAAIGVRIARWVTSHGFALNVTTDLAYFQMITPCGLVGRGVTSMERLLGQAPAMADVKAAVARHTREVFGAE